MKHYGDITKISGYDVEPVDVVTGGSPCQDLSVAGKRAGLDGERSGLFMEQIRVIREMRERDVRTGRANESVRPRWMVWENVPGAFSSNNGEDFRIVLEETARVVDKTATIPRPSNGKWSNSGTVLGNGFSISWKVHDGQFWGKSIISPSGEVVKRGTPQRRRRISLVADFGGQRAGEVLFEPKGVSGDSEPCGTQREETSRCAVPSSDSAEQHTVIYEMQHSCDVIRQNVDVSPTLQNRMGTGGNNVPLALQCVPLEGNGARASHRGNGYGDVGDPSFTLNSVERHSVAIGDVVVSTTNTNAEISLNGVSPSLLQRAGTGGGNVPMVIESYGFLPRNGSRTRGIGFEKEKIPTLKTDSYCGSGVLISREPYQDTTGTLAPGAHAGSYNGQDAYNDMLVVDKKTSTNVIRRLTLKECERLQGFPDDWTNIGDWIDSKGKKHKDADSPRYKALGNSICLPFWEWLAKKICAEYDRPVTMASLFDGIGGFPLAFERAGAKAVWASEIEEFPIAVTKVRFPEDVEAKQE